MAYQFVEKGKFQNSWKEKKDFKKKDGKDSQFAQGIMCYKCNNHGHLKKECPNYLRGKGKVYAITLLVTQTPLIQTRKKAAMERETTLHL